jgi:hypothetical protein
MPLRRARARDEPPVVVSRYDGRRLLGHVHGPVAGRFEARTWPEERLVGTYRTRAEACTAIDRAALQGPSYSRTEASE